MSQPSDEKKYKVIVTFDNGATNTKIFSNHEEADFFMKWSFDKPKVKKVAFYNDLGGIWTLIKS